MLAIVMAVPVAFLAARNTTLDTRIMCPIALLIIVSSRSINSLSWSLLLISIIGPGVVAGMIAISLRSIGFIAKLLYEAIEEIDPNQVEAATATGARGSQVIALRNHPSDPSCFRWHFCLPLGHQHTGIH